MTDDREKTSPLVKANTSSLQKVSSTIVSRGLSDLAFLDDKIKNVVNIDTTDLFYVVDSFGEGGPDVFSDETTIYINEDHPIYKIESIKADKISINIKRLIIQDIPFFLSLVLKLMYIKDYVISGEDKEEGCDKMTLMEFYDFLYKRDYNAMSKNKMFCVMLEISKTDLTNLDESVYIPTTSKKDKYLKKGVNYRFNKNYDKSIDAFISAYILAFDPIIYYFYCGFTNYSKGYFDKAVAYYSKTIKLDPDFSFVYIRRGFAYEDLGNKSMAISDYRKACDLGYEKGCENLQRILGEK